MSNNVKWALVIGSGLLAAAIVYVFTSDVVWSVIGLLGAFSVGKAVAHPGSAG
jgi:hypothetical protein